MLRSLLGLFAFAAAASAAATQVDLANVAQLSARGDHACVVGTAGGAKCWGSNVRGQLGAGAVGDYRSSAADVGGLASGVVAAAAALGAHTCAIVSGGAVKCWGANESGQLGDGTTTDRATPVDVQGLPAAAVAISGGASHTCAVLTDGTVVCWGNNSFGQLGDGTTTNRLAPTLVPGLSSVFAVSAARSHTCAITASGGVQCWGANDRGQLGNGTTAQSLVPVGVSGFLSGAASIDTSGESGSRFAMPESRSCVTTSAGALKCWGAGNNVPADVPGFNASAASVSVSVWRYFAGVLLSSYGEENDCAVTSTGSVKCWGTTPWCGLIGNGTGTCTASDIMANAVAPADVVGLASGVTSVSVAGNRFACALLTSGAVKCWGDWYGTTPAAAQEGTSPQRIAFSSTAPTGMAVGSTATLGATPCCSHNPITFSSLTASTCTVSGTTVTAIAGGTCTVAADQAGSALFDPAPRITMSFAIDPRKAQAITFGPLPTVTVNGVGYVSATSSSGFPVTIALQFDNLGYCSLSGNLVRGLQAGTCYLVATQAGDATYMPAPAVYVQLPITVNAGTQPLTVYTFGGGVGRVVSSPPGIDCGASCAGNFTTGATVMLTATASAGSRFAAWSGACTGAGSCTVTMDAAKSVNAIFDADVPRLAALSTRGRVDNTNNTLIGGFVIDGTAPKTVVVRARGPSLFALGVSNPVQDPKLQVVRATDGVTIAQNDAASLAPNAADMQAMGYGVSNNLEAEVMVTLAPGAYTTIVTPNSPLYGVGLFEVFEVDGATQPLIGLSTRGQVLTGDNVLIAGFIIRGNAPQKVVVRGRGPSLAAQGVTGVLANPALQVVRSPDGAVIGTNDDWQQDGNAAALSASGYAPTDPSEAALLMTLPPGAYTAILSGALGSAGTGIVEVYRVP